MSSHPAVNSLLSIYCIRSAAFGAGKVRDGDTRRNKVMGLFLLGLAGEVKDRVII